MVILGMSCPKCWERECNCNHSGDTSHDGPWDHIEPQQPHRPDSIVDIALCMQEAITTFQALNPDNTSQDDAMNYAILRAMRFGRGKYNPETLKSFLFLERSVYRANTNMYC